MPVNRDYLEMLCSHGMHPVINSPTREEMINNCLVQSALDHIFLRHEKKVNLYSGVVTCKISDHYLTFAAFCRGKIATGEADDFKYKDILHFGRYKNELRNMADKFQIDETKSLESYYDDYISAVKEAKVKSTLAVKRKHHCTPKRSWITGNILDLIKERDLMFRKWKNSKTEKKNLLGKNILLSEIMFKKK